MRAGQRGAVLITGIILIVVIALMVATLGFLYVSNLRSSSLHSSSEQAYFAAFSGLERATRVLNSPTISGAVAPDVNRVPCASLTGNAAVTAVNLVANKGQFTVTGGAAVSPATAVTLNGALTATATVIPVTTLAALGGYSASGRIMIDRELIDYSGTSNVVAVCGTAPCFVGVRRGVGGSTATLHATGTRVGQFQCNVQATGAVPDLVNPRAQRILSQGTQIHEGWAVGVPGAAAAQQPWFVRFRETAFSDFAPSPLIANANVQINQVVMLSNADGFAVGNPGTVPATQPFVARWDGITWNSINTGLNIGRALNSISCVSANDCWAVGVAGGPGSRPWIVQWNGTLPWTTDPIGAAGVNADLNDVYCVSTAECYAVGAPGAPGKRPFTVRQVAGTWTVDNNAAINVTVALNGVHCAASNDCWAVGDPGGVPAQQPFVIRWQGAAWSVFNTGLNLILALQSVYCVAFDDCWAVGNPGAAAQQPFVIHWNGTAWTSFNTGLATSAILRRIRCGKTDDCWAVGDAVGGAEFILKWNGTAWTRYNDAGGTVANNNLRAVSVLGAAQRAPAARQEVYP
jgi:Tfp pilus assembly protein PilX